MVPSIIGSTGAVVAIALSTTSATVKSSNIKYNKVQMSSIVNTYKLNDEKSLINKIYDSKIKIVLDNKNIKLNTIQKESVKNAMATFLKEEKNKVKTSSTLSAISTLDQKIIYSQGQSESSPSSTQLLVRTNKTLKNLYIAHTTFTAAAITAGVAAAGFAAAAFFSFGATTPWAVGCTVAATISGVVAGGLQVAIDKLENVRGLIGAGHALVATTKIAVGVVNTLKAILITSAAGLTGVAWAFPGALALVGVIASIYPLISDIQALS